MIGHTFAFFTQWWLP